LNEASGAISGFADAPSVNVGGKIRFAISTRTPGETYTISIFRLGWYNGSGAHLILQQANLTGQDQGYWIANSDGIHDCPTCEIDPQTGLIDTHWAYNYTLAIPSDWVSGEYLAMLKTQQGDEAYIIFVLRDDQRRSDILVQLPYLTYQAYNKWGGNSLYTNTPTQAAGMYGNGQAVKVSFNRPFDRLGPIFLSNDIQAIHFFERYGYDVSYTTSVDVDRDPTTLLGHRAFISVGHDEYWTKNMRDAAERGRDQGVNLAFWGGNDLYWQARLEPEKDGNPLRTMVLYRIPGQDPLAKTDPANASAMFVDPQLERPQNSLTGTIFGGFIENPPGVPWVVAKTAPEQLLAGTGLTQGDSVPALTGKECDTAVDNGFQPKGLIILAASPMRDKEGQMIICDTTWYQAGSGAYVFNAGTLSWTGVLDNFGHHNPGLHADQRLIMLMKNMLNIFGVLPGTG
jgi:hypothetical protein